ncbi:MAG: hypothetical protein V3T82_08080 [Nitrospinaceae bacterium]
MNEYQIIIQRVANGFIINANNEDGRHTTLLTSIQVAKDASDLAKQIEDWAKDSESLVNEDRPELNILADGVATVFPHPFPWDEISIITDIQTNNPPSINNDGTISFEYPPEKAAKITIYHVRRNP